MVEKWLASKENVISEAAAQKLAEKFASKPQYFSQEVANCLNEEKRRCVWLSLALALVSLMIMGGVYWLSLYLGGVDAIKTFAVPIIGAFCFVVLVINVAFTMVVIKVMQ